LSFKEVCVRFDRKRQKHYTTLLGFRIGSAALITLGLSCALFSSQHLQRTIELRPTAVHTTVKSAGSHVQPLGRSEPLRLQIDKVEIDAPMVAVGLNSDQTMEVPGPHDVGWYDKGPTPGEKGPAVLVGHVDYIDDIAVFWRLRELAPGDTFKIIRTDGAVVTFRVDSIKQFDQDNFPTQAVYGPLNYAGIRLITCGGTFNPETHHYTENTVVFGAMISSSK
jgi:sortase (surface protein transpeptidase)